MICGNVKYQRFILATGLSPNKPRQAVFSLLLSRVFTFIHPQPENKSTYQVMARIASLTQSLDEAIRFPAVWHNANCLGKHTQRLPSCCFFLSKLFNYLLARGRWELSWAFPSGLSRDQVHVEETRCGRTSTLYCSVVTVSRSQVQHTGLFRCRYRHRTRKQTSIYVYVTGKKLQLLPESTTYFLFSGTRWEGPHSFTPSCLLFISPG